MTTDGPDGSTPADAASHRGLARVVTTALSQVPPIAWSTDGIEFEYEAPLVHPIDIGGHVEIATDDGRRYLGSVISKDVVRRTAPSLTLDIPDEVIPGMPDVRVAEARIEPQIKVLQGRGALLCRLDGVTPSRCGGTDRFLDADLELVDAVRAASIVGGHVGSGQLDVGQMAGLPARVTLRAAGFNRHSFLCGQSGSGKTFAVGVLLERLLTDTDLRIVILDPNGDYVRLGQPRDVEDVVGPEVIPGMPTVAEMLERYRGRCADVAVLRPRSSLSATTESGSDPVPGARPLVLDLTDLEVDALARTMSLDPVRDADSYSALVDLHRYGVERGGLSIDDATRRALHDPSDAMRALGLRASNIGLGRWGLWATPGETSVIEVLRSEARVVVVDLSGFGDRREAATASLAILDHLWASRDERRATLIAIDEAHNVCPSASSDPLQRAASDQVDRIAAEGRKFGLHLLLATQRPNKVPPNALSQCENLVLLRMNSSSDIAMLAETFSFVPASLIEQARRFGQGETLIAGGIVGGPALARFDRRLSREPGGDVSTAWATPS